VIIDAHAHVIPREILRDRAPAEAWRPRLVSAPGESPSVLEIFDSRQRNVRHEFVDPEGLLAAFDRLGVERVVLSPFVGLLRYGAPPDDCLASSQIQNDGIADLARRRPGRIVGLGTVPLQDVGRAVGELERLMTLGLKGVEVGANVEGRLPGRRALPTVLGGEPGARRPRLRPSARDDAPARVLHEQRGR
jgi:aminocarboxymuconate-semialdehyde decarboxylase